MDLQKGPFFNGLGEQGAQLGGQASRRNRGFLNVPALDHAVNKTCMKNVAASRSVNRVDLVGGPYDHAALSQGHESFCATCDAGHLWSEFSRFPEGVLRVLMAHDHVGKGFGRYVVITHIRRLKT